VENFKLCYSEKMFDPDLPAIQARLNHYMSTDSFSGPEQKFAEMGRLCEKFKHPELACPPFHITGSKGKGSTSAYLASILDEAGYKVGRLSSPYVIHFGERFQLGDNSYFAETEYLAAMDELEKGLRRLHIEKLPHSILMTLYAFLLFRVAKCDFAVIEVSMGGRLDPSNVVQPEVSIITTIELEHQAILGNTISKIALEKAGIIKPKRPVVIASQSADAERVLTEVVKTQGSELLQIQSEQVQNLEYYFSDSYDEFTGRLMLRAEVMSKYFGRLDLNLKMLGSFQAENALLAIEAAGLANLGIKSGEIIKALARVELPGRFDMRRNILGFDQIPYLIIDGAHTVSSIRGGMQIFKELRRLESIKNAQDSCLTDFKPGAEPLLLFSTASDKAVEAMARELTNNFSEVILTTLEYKKTNPKRLLEAFADFKTAFIEDPTEAAKTALEKANHEHRPLVVLGSMYLAGTVYHELENTVEGMHLPDF